MFDLQKVEKVKVRITNIFGKWLESISEIKRINYFYNGMMFLEKQ